MEVFNNRDSARRHAMAFRSGSLKDGIHYMVGAKRRREEENNTEAGKKEVSPCRKTGGNPSIHPTGVISFADPLITSPRGQKTTHSQIQTCILTPLMIDLWKVFAS